VSVSLALVLVIQSRIQDECQLVRHNPCPIHAADYTKVGDAEAVRVAVSELAPDVETAIDGILFAAYESGNDVRAVGDHGQSTGAWQTIDGGKTAKEQFAKWLIRRKTSLDICGNLAKVASGSCHRGLRLAYRRAIIKSAILDSLRDDGRFDADLGQRNKEN
jgi:hypothetical protein